MVIAVCGCMVQQEEVVGHILNKYGHVDLIFGAHNLRDFPELLYKTFNSDSTVTDISSCDSYIAEVFPSGAAQHEGMATVMYSCNFYPIA